MFYVLDACKRDYIFAVRLVLKLPDVNLYGIYFIHVYTYYLLYEY